VTEGKAVLLTHVHTSLSSSTESSATAAHFIAPPRPPLQSQYRDITVTTIIRIIIVIRIIIIVVTLSPQHEVDMSFHFSQSFAHHPGIPVFVNRRPMAPKLGAIMAPQRGKEAFTAGPQARPRVDSQACFSIAINCCVQTEPNIKDLVRKDHEQVSH